MSEVILDTITGKSTATTITIGSTPVVSASANSMTIRGEGSNQTSIQQGLAKCWYLDNEGGSNLDSFNVASNTDNSTGNYTKGFTTNFSSGNFSAPSACAQNTSTFVINSARATSSVTTANIKHDNTAIDGRQACNICGDLA